MLLKAYFLVFTLEIANQPLIRLSMNKLHDNPFSITKTPTTELQIFHSLRPSAGWKQLCKCYCGDSFTYKNKERASVYEVCQHEIRPERTGSIRSESLFWLTFPHRLVSTSEEKGRNLRQRVLIVFWRLLHEKKGGAEKNPLRTLLQWHE